MILTERFISQSVSVVIPVYNAAPWLERCIASIRMQTHRELEIILVDDGSTDASLEICESARRSDKRIHTLSQKNNGAAAARNAGISRATGEFLMFVDADDFIDPDMVEKLLAGIKTPGCDWSLCGFRWIRGYGEAAEVLSVSLNAGGMQAPHEALMGFARGNVDAMVLFGSMCNKIYQTSIIRNNALFVSTDIFPHEDLAFNLAYMRFVRAAFFVDEPLYAYQAHSGTANAVRRYRKHAIELHNTIYGLIKDVIWRYCTCDEKRNFNRHYLDKSLIIMAMLCRDNPFFDQTALKEKLAAMLSGSFLQECLQSYVDHGSQPNEQIELIRNGRVDELYELSRRRGNKTYGGCIKDS